ncbi:MAG: hypothetical protein FWF53_03415 [Candidatus Azobacteroides sp.]|nr:hypothetical protein [Candidatus Azobacteroides sp.]
MDEEGVGKTFLIKEYTYLGVPMIVFLLLSSVIFFLLLLIINKLFYIWLLLIAATLFGLLCFYNITITIDESYFSFKLGIGLIKKKYKIENIKSCNLYSGIHKGFGVGTKVSFAGKMLKQYNVTGLKAIELQFYDNDIIVKIGTPQPDEISQCVQELIKKRQKSVYIS